MKLTELFEKTTQLYVRALYTQIEEFPGEIEKWWRSNYPELRIVRDIQHQDKHLKKYASIAIWPRVKTLTLYLWEVHTVESLMEQDAKVYFYLDEREEYGFTKGDQAEIIRSSTRLAAIIREGKDKKPQEYVAKFIADELIKVFTGVLQDITKLRHKLTNDITKRSFQEVKEKALV